MSEEVLKSPQVAEEVVSNKPKKKKRPLPVRIIGWVLYGIFGAFFVLVISANISGEIHKSENHGQSIRFGYGSFIVITNSMEPDIGVNDAIITHKDNLHGLYERYQKDKIIDITFANIRNNADNFTPDNPNYTKNYLVIENRVMTHRLMELHYFPDVEYGNGQFIFVTSGINDEGHASKKNQHQKFTEKEYLGTVCVVNPVLGKMFQFIVSPIGLLILLLVPAMYLIITSTIDIFRVMKKSEQENAEAAAMAGSGERLASMSNDEKERLKKELLEEMKNKRKEQMKNEHKD